MHANSLDQWTHEHVFLGAQHAQNERKTWFVVALTVAMMIAEIGAGSIFGSMALLADGWHMATHAAALGIAGAFLGLGVNLASAWLLRGSHDHHHGHVHGSAHDHGDEADDDDNDDENDQHDHDHHHADHRHRGHGHGHDHNLRAAYIHVLADAA